MTTIARLAVVAAAAVAGAAVWDVRWQRLWRERERELNGRIQKSYDHSVTPSVARDNSGRAAWTRS